MIEGVGTVGRCLESILDSIPDPFFCFDRAWRCFYLNDAAAKTFGLSREAALSQPLWQVIPALAGTQLEKRFRQAMLDQTRSHIEWDGLPDRCFEWQIYPSVKTVTVLAIDITERKRATRDCQPRMEQRLPTQDAVNSVPAGETTEEALRKSEERFQLAMRAVDGLVFEWDLETNAVHRSGGLYQLVGVHPEEAPATADWWIERVHPEDLARQQERFPALLEDLNRERYEGEYRVRHEDGRWLDVWERGYLVRGDDRRVVQVIGFTSDITARKQAEEAQRKSAEHLSLALSASRMGTWSWNATTDIVTFSPRAVEIFGIPTDPPLTWTQLRQRLHEEDRERARIAVEAAIAYRSHYDIEYRVCVEGGYRWVLARGHANYDASGNVVSMLGVVQDVTDRKQAEHEREEILKREQAARQEAEAANQLKDEFLAVLSHELRSPLNPILGWAKLLRSRKFDEAATDRALETIERNARLQTQLIEDLLDVSRILRGKMMLNVAPVNLAAIIRAAVETVRLAAETKGLQIQTRFAPEVGRVFGDAARLQQVLGNLLSNAVKFTPDGGRIEVRLTQVGALAQIQVSDTGKGIRPEFLPHIFEYFRQEDSTTTRRFGGLGLGLAIVRQLTELHGGTVWAESPGDGLGSTFTVRLPLIPQEVNKPSSEMPTASNSIATALPLQGLKILVVDDEADMRELVAFIVQQAGATAEVVQSAAEALFLLRESLPDLIISDIGMPDMDGHHLIRQVRSRSAEQGGQIPAIALTAYAGEMDQQRAIVAGFQRHLAKPIEPEELVAAILSIRGAISPTAQSSG